MSLKADFQKQISFFKEYIFPIKNLVLISLGVFAFSTFFGYFFAQNFPQEMELVVKELQEVFASLAEMPVFGQFLMIFLNNSITTFLVIALGLVFGILPFLVLFSNGLVLGIVAYFAQVSAGWPVVFILTLPHGIIEIPVILLAGAVGFKLGRLLFNRVFRQKKEADIKLEMNTALSFFLRILLPLLLLAAAIEVFITGQLL